MCATVTDDDLEKRVESATGDEIGTVTDIDEETVRVDPQPGMLDSIRATLGWTSSGETISIHEDDIDEITAETVHLEDTAFEDDTAPDEPADATSPGSATEQVPDAADGSPTALESDPVDDSTAEPSTETTREPDEAAESATAAERESAEAVGSPTAAEREPRVDDDPTSIPDDASPRGDVDAARNEGPNAAEREDAYEDPVSGIDDEAEGMGTTEPIDEVDGGDATELLPGDDSSVTDDPAVDADEAGPVDAPSSDTDDDSLEDSRGSAAATRDESTGPDEGDESTDAQDLLADTGSGLDVESSADDSSGDISSDETPREDAPSDESVRTADAMDPADEIDPSLDLESATEPDRESATAAGATSERERTSDPNERADPAAEVDPGVDVVSTMHAEQASSAPIDPETIAGKDSDVETGPETAARRVVSDAEMSTEQDRAAGEQKRTPSRRDRASPVGAAVATQRAALSSGRAAVELGLESQRNAAKIALEGSTMVQRSVLDVMESSTMGYLNAVEATTRSTNERDRGQSEPEPSVELGDDDLFEAFEDHREYIRELRATIDDQDDYVDERLLDALERQAELLERCHRHLEAQSE